MRSEDIARYVAGLEEEVERLSAAQPALPDVGPVTHGSSGFLRLDGANWDDDTAVEYRHLAACYLALAAFKDAEAAAADTTPDTSRVTFGTRHEGTGMVLLQHDDSPAAWGMYEHETAEYHRGVATEQTREDGQRVAHAALAEVREALNTAEAAGVDVGAVAHHAYCPPGDGAARTDLQSRVREYLAREVQALVDQGLRGDELNARVPYEVRDHRAPVEADTTPDDEVEEIARIIHQEVSGIPWDAMAEEGHARRRAAARAVIVHRAARTSQEANQ